MTTMYVINGINTSRNRFQIELIPVKCLVRLYPFVRILSLIEKTSTQRPNVFQSVKWPADLEFARSILTLDRPGAQSLAGCRGPEADTSYSKRVWPCASVPMRWNWGKNQRSTGSLCYILYLYLETCKSMCTDKRVESSWSKHKYHICYWSTINITEKWKQY